MRIVVLATGLGLVPGGGHGRLQALAGEHSLGLSTPAFAPTEA
jgi:hypothetical protein